MDVRIVNVFIRIMYQRDRLYTEVEIPVQILLFQQQQDSLSIQIRYNLRLVPQSLVPVGTLDVGQVISLGVHGGVENQLGSIAAVLRPVEFVARPLGVGVASEDEGKEILLHLALWAKEWVSHSYFFSRNQDKNTYSNSRADGGATADSDTSSGISTAGGARRGKRVSVVPCC